jgi:hypothetical protein
LYCSEQKQACGSQNGEGGEGINLAAAEEGSQKERTSNCWGGNARRQFLELPHCLALLTPSQKINLFFSTTPQEPGIEFRALRMVGKHFAT